MSHRLWETKIHVDFLVDATIHEWSASSLQSTSNVLFITVAFQLIILVETGFIEFKMIPPSRSTFLSSWIIVPIKNWSGVHLVVRCVLFPFALFFSRSNRISSDCVGSNRLCWFEKDTNESETFNVQNYRLNELTVLFRGSVSSFERNCGFFTAEFQSIFDWNGLSLLEQLSLCCPGATFRYPWTEAQFCCLLLFFVRHYSVQFRNGSRS